MLNEENVEVLERDLKENLEEIDTNEIDELVEEYNKSIVLTDSIGSYLSALSRYPTLSTEEEKKLFSEYQQTGRTDHELKQKLICHNLKLVVAFAKKYNGLYSLELNDLIQYGNLGLIRAIETFDVERGYKFSTYASWWIKQSITRSVMDTANLVRVPVHMFEKVNSYKRWYQEYIKESGKEPTKDEINTKLDSLSLSDANLGLCNSLSNIVSLETPIGEDEDSILSDIIKNDDLDVERDSLNSIQAEELHKVLNMALSERELNVISLRFGLEDNSPKTLEEVGAIYGVTRERIRQIECKALRKLRSPKYRRMLAE